MTKGTKSVAAVSAVKAPEPDRETGINSLTAAESAMAERKAGQSVTTLGNDAFPQVALIGALGWVLARRGDVRLTYEAYMSSRRVDQIAAELGLTDDDSEGDDDTGESSAPST